MSGACATLSEFVGIDNNETEPSFMEQEFGDSTTRFFLCDLRDLDGLRKVCNGIDIVFHPVVLKHMGICERSSSDAVNSNIIGRQNLVRVATLCEIDRLRFTSPDKAVNPTKCYGRHKTYGSGAGNGGS